MLAASDAGGDELRGGAVKLVVIISAFAGLAAMFCGCAPKPTVLGSDINGAPVRIAAAGAKLAGAPVVLEGTMIKKCPAAGCWFVLQDESGTIKVDTKDSGFVVVDVPLNTRLLAAGHVVTNGTQRLLAATGIRY